MESKTRFAMLWRCNPQAAAAFLDAAQDEVRRRFAPYQAMAGRASSNAGQGRGASPADTGDVTPKAGSGIT